MRRSWFWKEKRSRRKWNQILLFQSCCCYCYLTFSSCRRSCCCYYHQWQVWPPELQLGGWGKRNLWETWTHRSEQAEGHQIFVRWQRGRESFRVSLQCLFKESFNSSSYQLNPSEFPLLRLLPRSDGLVSPLAPSFITSLLHAVCLRFPAGTPFSGECLHSCLLPPTVFSRSFSPAPPPPPGRLHPELCLVLPRLLSAEQPRGGLSAAPHAGPPAPQTSLSLSAARSTPSPAAQLRSACPLPLSACCWRCLGRAARPGACYCQYTAER